MYILSLNTIYIPVPVNNYIHFIVPCVVDEAVHYDNIVPEKVSMGGAPYMFTLSTDYMR